MTLFHILAKDKPGALNVRTSNRSAHLAWIGDYPYAVKTAGPLLSDEGEMIGSMLLIEAESREALEVLLSEDPYAKAGLFQSVEITPFKGVIGAPD